MGRNYWDIIKIFTKVGKMITSNFGQNNVKPSHGKKDLK